MFQDLDLESVSFWESSQEPEPPINLKPENKIEDVCFEMDMWLSEVSVAAVYWRRVGAVSCILLYIWVFFTLLPYESLGGHYPSDNKEIILKVVTKLLTLDTGVLNLVQSGILNSRIIFRAEPLQ